MVSIIPMTMRHYEQVLALWQASPGVHVNLAGGDSREDIGRYLRRNRGLSVVALEGDKVVGVILAGHDGRRGLLHHLAVAQSHQRQGLGKRLVEQAMDNLRPSGLHRAWILIIADNTAGRQFWKSLGWAESDSVVFASKDF